MTPHVSELEARGQLPQDLVDLADGYASVGDFRAMRQTLTLYAESQERGALAAPSLAAALDYSRQMMAARALAHYLDGARA